MEEKITIEQIRAFTWVGNHFSDSEKMEAISKFVESDVPMAEKQEALLIMQRDAMGIEGTITEEDVEHYLRGG
jgi:hypothetical protein